MYQAVMLYAAWLRRTLVLQYYIEQVRRLRSRFIVLFA